MKKFLLPLLVTALAGFAAPAAAAVFTESFDAPFAGWENRWFANNSNAKRFFYYADERGNNGTGLTIYDGNQDDGNSARIVFDAAFGAKITNFSFDMLSYNVQNLVVYDMAGVTLLDVSLSAVDGPPFDFADSKYTRFSIDSTNGIGGFSLLPFGAEGNVSIDDLSVTTVPEPATWGLMIGGFGAVGTMLRRRRTALTA